MVGGLYAIQEAIYFAVKFEKISILKLLLAVGTEQKLGTWARCFVWSRPGFRDCATPGRNSSHDFACCVAAYTYGGPILHCAAEYCSLRAIRMLLSS